MSACARGGCAREDRAPRVSRAQRLGAKSRLELTSNDGRGVRQVLTKGRTDFTVVDLVRLSEAGGAQAAAARARRQHHATRALRRHASRGAPSRPGPGTRAAGVGGVLPPGGTGHVAARVLCGTAASRCPSSPAPPGSSRRVAGLVWARAAAGRGMQDTRARQEGGGRSRCRLAHDPRASVCMGCGWRQEASMASGAAALVCGTGFCFSTAGTVGWSGCGVRGDR